MEDIIILWKMQEFLLNGTNTGSVNNGEVPCNYKSRMY